MKLRIICSTCEKLTYNRGHGLCNLCYTRWYNNAFKDEIDKRRKKRWPEYYKKTKEARLAYKKEYSKTDKYKKYKTEYDKKRRDLLRFNGNRSTVLKKANYKCEICGDTKELHVHHIDGNSYHNGIPNNNLNNLMVVCRNCHYNKIHKKHGPLKETTKRKISEKKKQRDVITKKIKNSSILPDGELRQCELCGLSSKRNSVINAIALDDCLNFLPYCREAHKLTIEEKKQLGQGIHFICLAIVNCRKKKAYFRT